VLLCLHGLVGKQVVLTQVLVTWVNSTFCVFRALGYSGDEIAKAKECDRILFYNVSVTQENAS
jgi:hypothetical protein